MQECKATASISHTALLPCLLWDFPKDVHQLHRVLCVRLCGQMTTKVWVKTASHFFPSEPSQNLNSGLQRGKLAKPPTVIISATFTAGRSSGKREKNKKLRGENWPSTFPAIQTSMALKLQPGPLEGHLSICLHPLVSYFYPKAEKRTKDTKSNGTFLPYFSSIQK